MRGDASIYGAMVIAMLIVIASSMMFNYLVSLKNFQNEQASILSQIASKVRANVWFTPNGSSIILHPDRHMGVMSIVIYDSNRVYYMNTGSSPLAYASPSNPLNLSTIVPQTYIQMVMQGNTYLGVLMDNGVLYTYRYNPNSGTPNTYYLDATAGYYYVIMSSKNITAYYLDSNGNRRDITTYRWDINPNWVIFQAPATTRIYLTVTNTSLSIFNTPSNWFSWQPVYSPTPYYEVTVTFPSPWSTSRTGYIYPASSTTRTSLAFDGIRVIAINTTTYYFSSPSSIKLSAGTNSPASLGATYTATINVRGYYGAMVGSVSSYPRGLFRAWWCTFSPDGRITACSPDAVDERDQWYYEGGDYATIIRTVWLSYTPGSYSVSIYVQPYTASELNAGPYEYYLFPGNIYEVTVRVYPSGSVSFSSAKVYDQNNRVITTDTGARIYVVGSLDSLPTA
jgi:hypothetical protein